jgi:hypothetical protein
MAKKKNLSPKYQVWIDARKRFHLSHDHIRMARELGLNPKKFGKLANHKQEPWKLPLPEYIEYLYLKHFKKEPLKNSLSIEQHVKLKKQKNAERKERKRQEKAKEGIEHVPATNPDYDDIPF